MNHFVVCDCQFVVHLRIMLLGILTAATMVFRPTHTQDKKGRHSVRSLETALPRDESATHMEAS